MDENIDKREFINTLETKQSNKPKAPFPQPKPVNGFFEKSHD